MAERSKPPLHNFSLPPRLQWGSQKFLRCMKLSPKDNTHIPKSQSQSQSQPQSQSQSQSSPTQNPNQSDSHSPIRFTYSRSSPTSGKPPIRRRFGDADPETDNNGVQVQAVGEKLNLDLQVAAKKLKVSVLEQGVEQERPWNLRTRRAACKAPEAMRVEVSEAAPRPEGVRIGDQRKERAAFSVSLSKEEVEEDFSAMLGKRVPRRPKKRARVVQRQVESLFPGFWLTEVTPESYKVPDSSGRG